MEKEFCNFLDQSPSPFHAVAQMKEMLQKAGYSPLEEKDAWSISKGKYYVTRGMSSIVAFHINKEKLPETGWRMLGAHTDSPCLKLRPLAQQKRHGYRQMYATPYGGMLFSPWFDRDLSLAGLVSYEGSKGDICHQLIDIKKAIAVVPNLAIHLYRDANKNRTINSEAEMHPVYGLGDGKSWEDLILDQINPRPSSLLAFDLCLYDTQKASVVGMNDELLVGARLDNLLSCYLSTKSLIDGDGENTLIVANDHEEVGSRSFNGADGFFLRDVLDRLLPEGIPFSRVMAQSHLISADNAHGLHPNYPDKHDLSHRPLLGKGPVIKINVNHRYASVCESTAPVELLAKKNSIDLQKFTNRSDMGCGSTIGPVTAALLGVPTLDIGIPTWGMHSIRETMAVKDLDQGYRLFKAYLT